MAHVSAVKPEDRTCKQVRSTTELCSGEDKTCYICLSPYAGEHETERVLERNPCKCKGTIYMHGSCLLEYRCTNKHNKCGICKTEFNYQIEYDKLRNIKACGLYFNGKKEGIWKEYYSDIENKNKLIAECTYVNGQLNGHAKYYSSLGLVIVEGNYVNNVVHGIWRRYTELGCLVEECTYINGDKTGPVITYY